jgi:hypothetical protein
MSQRMPPTDERGRLESFPFNYRLIKVGDVHISRGGRLITILRGRAAQRFLSQSSDLNPLAAQHLKARVTGQYKRGNERRTAD